MCRQEIPSTAEGLPSIQVAKGGKHRLSTGSHTEAPGTPLPTVLRPLASIHCTSGFSGSGFSLGLSHATASWGLQLAHHLGRTCQPPKSRASSSSGSLSQISGSPVASVPLENAGRHGPKAFPGSLVLVPLLIPDTHHTLPSPGPTSPPSRRRMGSSSPSTAGNVLGSPVPRTAAPCRQGYE